MGMSGDLSVMEDGVSQMQGVAILRDAHRGVFVHVVKASAPDSTFKTSCSKLEKASKKPDNGNDFENGHQFKLPDTEMWGEAKGAFCDLNLMVGVAINPSSNTECLTRTSRGMFHWSEWTINKTENVSVEDKQMRLVVSMFSLFLNLMLDMDDNLLEGCHFKEFMNKFSLRKATK